MMSELSTSRAQLEREQREAKRLRVETEATRNEYRKKLERLQKRRDELFRSLRDDLDAAFREAHEEVARVVRELQRGGTPHSRDAERARQELLGLEEKAQRAEKEAGVHARAAPNPPPVGAHRGPRRATPDPAGGPPAPPGATRRSGGRPRTPSREGGVGAGPHRSERWAGGLPRPAIAATIVWCRSPLPTSTISRSPLARRRWHR